MGFVPCHGAWGGPNNGCDNVAVTPGTPVPHCIFVCSIYSIVHPAITKDRLVTANSASSIHESYLPPDR